MLRGDPTLTQATSPPAATATASANMNEDSFMQMITEMNRICGDDEEGDNTNMTGNCMRRGSSDQGSDGGGSEAKRQKLDVDSFNFMDANASAENLLLPSGSDSGNDESITLHAATDDASPGTSGMGIMNDSASPLSNLLMAASNTGQSSSRPSSKGDLLSQALTQGVSGSVSGQPPVRARSGRRSRHGSATSSQSGTSFDSAIGDVYSVQTPPRATSSFDFEQDLLLDPAAASTAVNPTDTMSAPQLQQQPAGPVDDCHQSPEEQQLQQLLSDDTSPSTAVSGPPTYSSSPASAATQQLQINATYPGQGQIVSPSSLGSIPGVSSSDPAYNMPQQQPPVYPSSSSYNPSSSMLRNGPSVNLSVPPRYQKRRNLLHSRQPSPSPYGPLIPPHLRPHPPYPYPPMLPLHGVHHPHQLLMAQRHEVDEVCIDLSRRFYYAAGALPRRRDLAADASADPLGVTTLLLTDTLSRIRMFLFSLEPMSWLCWRDRNALYAANLCSTTILKAATTVDLSTLPAAYPLPYGEYLGEVEALHLILAHDLYNELRALVRSVQGLEIREFPVMLLVIMVAFFTPLQALEQPDKVVKVHDYYLHKLQIYLNLRFGPTAAPPALASIMGVIDKVKNFAGRLREFLADVTKTGLQKQFESVCENIGLMAFLLQSEPVAPRSSAPMSQPMPQQQHMPQFGQPQVLPTPQQEVQPPTPQPPVLAPLPSIETVTSFSLPDDVTAPPVVSIPEDATVSVVEEPIVLLEGDSEFGLSCGLSSGQQIMADAMSVLN